MKDFNFGKTVPTAAVFDKMVVDEGFGDFVFESLESYMNCDWGDTCKEDAKMNDDAVKSCGRILAVYIYRKGTPEETTIWIITEWDRSATTVLFPSEY